VTFSDPLPAAPALWRRDHDQTEPFDRRSGIGASEAPALFGLSPRTTARELYGLKTGELPDRVANDVMDLGTLLEEPIRVAGRASSPRPGGTPSTPTSTPRPMACSTSAPAWSARTSAPTTPPSGGRPAPTPSPTG
jgi:hypothetical protein